MASLGTLGLDLFFPKSCTQCKKEGAYLCDQCEAHIELSPAITVFQDLPIFSCYSYKEETVFAKLIQLWKYEFVTELEKMFQRLLQKNFKDWEVEFFRNGVLCPVPLSKKRLRFRGFNQAEKLAGMVSVLTEIPTVHLLERTIDTKPQIELSRKERLANVKGAFALAKNANLNLPPCSSIILVDDIVTTGATLHECAHAISRHLQPLANIRGFVLARALLPSPSIPEKARSVQD